MTSSSSDHILLAGPTHYQLPISCLPSSTSQSYQQPNSSLNKLPTELLYHIFDFLPTLDQSLDLLSTALVCRKWRGPAQSVLWRYLRFPAVDCVAAFALAAQQRPDLASLARRLNFFTDEPEYLASLDADAVFSAMESLTGLLRFQVTVPYASGELYDSLCEELSGSPVREVLLAAEEGIGRGHVQASMRFPALALLHLVRLGPLGDLISLAEDWSCPPTLTELVLVNPDLPGEDLSFLLCHTRPTLRKLRLDFGNMTAEDTQLREEDVSDSLIKYGEHLTDLEVLWINATWPFLNNTVVGLRDVHHISTTGPSFDQNMDINCPPSLKSVDYHILVNSMSPYKGTFEKFYEPTFRRSNATRYHLITYRIEESASAAIMEEDEVNRPEEWSQENIKEWKECSQKLKLNGISLTADFF